MQDTDFHSVSATQTKIRQRAGGHTMMEFAEIPGTMLKVSRVGLGTWAIGGWMWGGTDERESITTIRAALTHGINVIDTAPAYGFGRSEEIVGKAIADGLRNRVVLATKVGLEWHDGKLTRNASRERITQEIEDSLRRLRTDYIDIYQVHWPDPLTPIEETAEAMLSLLEQGKIRAIGVSNFSVEQMDQFRTVAPLHVSQPPYNLFERDIDKDIRPYCRKNGIATLGYGALCRGLLSGRIAPKPSSRAMTSGATIPSFSRRALRSISPQRSVSINWRRSATASASSTWRCAGCSIGASPRRFGARAIQISSIQSTPSWAGRSMTPPRPKSIAFFPKPSPIRWGPSSWRRRHGPDVSTNGASPQVLE